MIIKRRGRKIREKGKGNERNGKREYERREKNVGEKFQVVIYNNCKASHTRLDVYQITYRYSVRSENVSDHSDQIRLD